MDIGLTPDHTHANIVVIASAVAVLIAIAVVVAVIGLFQSRGRPMEELAAAERACAARAYVSEREHCMREWIAASHGNRVARE